MALKSLGNSVFIDYFAAKDKEMFDKGFRLADIALSMNPKDARKALYTGIWKGVSGFLRCP